MGPEAERGERTFIDPEITAVTWGGGGPPWPYSMADVIVVHRHNRGGRSMVASLSMGQVRRRNPRMFYCMQIFMKLLPSGAIVVNGAR